jgi:histone H3/H4
MPKKAKAVPKKKEPKKKEAAPEIEKGAFPEAAVVRVMKKHLDKEKMVRREVKRAMNKWLEDICETVSKRMNKIPYTMVSLNEFKEGIKVFETLQEFDKEKQRILAHLEAMKQDIYRLERDLGKAEDEVMEMS